MSIFAAVLIIHKAVVGLPDVATMQVKGFINFGFWFLKTPALAGVFLLTPFFPLIDPKPPTTLRGMT